MMQSRSNSPKERRKALADELQKRNLDTAIISDPKHFYYFTGFTSKMHLQDLFHRVSRSLSFLGISKDGTSFLVLAGSDLMNPFFGEEIITSKGIFNGPVYTYGDYKIRERIVPYIDFIAEELVEVLEDMGNKGGFNFGRVGVEDWHLAEVYHSEISRAFPEADFFGLSSTILSMREVKGDDEISYVREATKRLDFAFDMAKPLAKAGFRESELFRQINSEFSKKYGISAFVVGDIISGSRTGDVIGQPTDKRFEKGDSIILDLQTDFSNYWSDIARTFIVGRASDKQERVLKTLLKAQEKAESLLRPGTRGREIYQAASEEIINAGYSKGLIHHAGHGIGLDHREPPFFLPNSEGELKEGVVCSLELGIYETVQGVRIEDCYLVTKNGYQKISNSALEF
jgi:Xaa-Pro aminopeptidase